MNFPILLKAVKSKTELKKFVKFPFQLYKDNPYWISPIISEKMENFNPDKNPVMEHAITQLFLAYRAKRIVGRIATIINIYEIEKQEIKKIRFGWFNTIDNVEVSKALLDKVYQIGKKYKLNFIEGSLGFSNLDKVGVLTKGYVL